MKRRSFLAMLGLAPVVAVAPGPGTETVEIYRDPTAAEQEKFLRHISDTAVQYYSGYEALDVYEPANNACLANLKARGKIKDA